MSVISNKACSATVIAETRVKLFSILAKNIGRYTGPQCRIICRYRATARRPMPIAEQRNPEVQPSGRIPNNATSFRKLMAAIPILKKEIVPGIEALQGIMKMSALRKLGQRLKQIGSDCGGIESLVHYATQLCEYEETFDIVNIEKALSTFPALLASLIELTEQYDIP
ncbi:MAG: hypothetical protein GY866_00740 [Proteobacteria bacterium]|nr:hypothetical protein [Pseudomonadota bacterium]